MVFLALIGQLNTFKTHKIIKLSCPFRAKCYLNHLEIVLHVTLLGSPQFFRFSSYFLFIANDLLGTKKSMALIMNLQIISNQTAFLLPHPNHSPGVVTLYT